MGTLFEVKPIDMAFYEERLRQFLPERMIDIHAHVWEKPLSRFNGKRTVSWPSLVAKTNPVEHLLESYRLLFPGKTVTPLIFSNLQEEADLNELNDYVARESAEHGLPALLFAHPEWSADDLIKKVERAGFLGVKVYLSFAPAYIPRAEIRIFDFLPHHQLEALNERGLIVMLHIPRDARLRDPVNLAQMVEIEQRYPKLKLIIAHVGRAYCPEDVGNAFEVLRDTKRMLFDISANTCAQVFTQLIRAVGPKRVLFGSDLPIVRMRMRRICEGGFYINLVPEGLYPGATRDSHMREVRGEEAEKLTFFMYEELDAFRRAAEATDLTREDVKDVFHDNAAELLASVRGPVAKIS